MPSEQVGVMLGDGVIAAAEKLAEQQIIALDSAYEQAVRIDTPQGQKIKALEFLAFAPYRRRGTVEAVGVQSFADLVFALERTPEARIYYTDAGVMTAVLNDDTADGAGWRDHRIVMTPPFHESFKAWVAINGVYRPQLEMAEFIEERIVDFKDPPGASMLELAQKFEIVRSGSFASAVRLSTGSTSLTLEENTTGKMDITIPERVVLGMRVFDDEEAFQFPAWFRYRVRDRHLSFCFKVENIERVQRSAVQALVTKAKGLLPNNKFFQGATPPVAAL